MSYDGKLGFGLLADYDAVPGLEQLADDLRAGIATLARAAGKPAKRPARGRNGGRASRPRTPARPTS